jgi:hypothetical protein
MSLVSNLSSITRASDVAAAKAAPSKAASGMGQQDFLKLFTTQLQNQNPLDPTKNEAFVAQLAQFSQLEATTNMATQLTSFVSSQSGDRMLAGASLIGKKVALEGVPATMIGGQPVQGVISLPNGGRPRRRWRHGRRRQLHIQSHRHSCRYHQPSAGQDPDDRSQREPGRPRQRAHGHGRWRTQRQVVQPAAHQRLTRPFQKISPRTRNSRSPECLFTLP